MPFIVIARYKMHSLRLYSAYIRRYWFICSQLLLKTADAELCSAACISTYNTTYHETKTLCL